MNIEQALAAMNTASAAERGETTDSQASELNNSTQDNSDLGLGDENDGLGESPAANHEAEDEDVSLELPDDDDEDHSRAAVEAPSIWKAEDKAKFAGLPREAQELILKTYQEDKSFFDSKVNETAASRKAFEQSNQVLNGKLNDLEAAIAISQNHLGQWSRIDWLAWYQSDPVAALQEQAIYQSHDQAYKAQVEAFNKAKQEQKNQAKAQTASQFAQMMDSDPVVKKYLTGPKAPDNTKKLADYAEKSGIGNRIVDYTPAELKVALQSMLYEEILANNTGNTKQSNSKSAPTKMKTQGGAPSQTSSQSVSAADRQFKAKPGLETALAKMNALSAQSRRGN